MHFDHTLHFFFQWIIVWLSLFAFLSVYVVHANDVVDVPFEHSYMVAYASHLIQYFKDHRSSAFFRPNYMSYFICFFNKKKIRMFPMFSYFTSICIYNYILYLTICVFVLYLYFFSCHVMFKMLYKF